MSNRNSSFRRFLQSVGMDSESSGRRSATLPTKGRQSSSTFYSHSTDDLCGLDVPSKSGWLCKQSRGLIRTWQARWFVLNGNYLMQYSSDDETQSPQCLLFLKNHVIREVTTPDSYSDDDQKFLFEITPTTDGSNVSLKSQETLLLAATSPDERRAWTQTVKQVLYRDNGGAIFGQKLETTLQLERERDPTRRIPEIVELCIENLREKSLDVDGLFRLPGRAGIIRTLREAFDVGGKRPSLEEADVNTIASLLKAYLCDLPEPIIPYGNYDRILFITTRERPVNADAAIAALSEAVRQLPTPNYDLLRYLCKFLSDVASRSDSNRMTSSNLATIFSPCIIRPEIDDPALLAGTSTNRSTVVEDLIDQFSRIFPPDSNSTLDTGSSTSSQVDLEQTPTEGTKLSVNGMTEDSTQSIVVDSNSLDTETSVNRVSSCNLMEFSGDTEFAADHTSSPATPRPVPMTSLGRELYSKITLLQQQLYAEKRSVTELRQLLVAEREEAARQREALARKLDAERMATSEAVARVMHLQTQLEQYSIKYGPLD